MVRIIFAVLFFILMTTSALACNQYLEDNCDPDAERRQNDAEDWAFARSLTGYMQGKDSETSQQPQRRVTRPRPQTSNDGYVSAPRAARPVTTDDYVSAPRTSRPVTTDDFVSAPRSARPAANDGFVSAPRPPKAPVVDRYENDPVAQGLAEGMEPPSAPALRGLKDSSFSSPVARPEPVARPVKVIASKSGGNRQAYLDPCSKQAKNSDDNPDDAAWRCEHGR